MQTIAKHYIDGTFVESHGRQVMDSIVGREFGTLRIEAFLKPRAILE